MAGDADQLGERDRLGLPGGGEGEVELPLLALVEVGRGGPGEQIVAEVDRAVAALQDVQLNGAFDGIGDRMGLDAQGGGEDGVRRRAGLSER